MTTPTPAAAVPGISQPGWPGTFPSDVQQQILSAVIGGAPFSRACTPLPTSRTSVGWPVLSTADPSWVAELDQIPDLNPSQSSYAVAVHKLAGTILISLEAINDTDFPVTQETERTLQDTFSGKLDKDLIGGSGASPIPQGILGVATAGDGTDMQLAVVKAKSDVGGAGGTATHFCVSPHHVGVIEGLRDTEGHQLYPDVSTTFCGLTTVTAVAATQPFVFDKSRVYLVINRDFAAEISTQTDAAWSRYAASLRVVGRFTLAVPQPSKACRKITVAGVAPAVEDERPAASTGKRSA